MATFISNGTPITSPSPQYDIPLVSNNGVIKVSPNVFDGAWETGIYNPSSGAKTNANNRIRSVNKIIVQPATTYTLSLANGTPQARWCFYDENQEFISSASKATVTTPDNAHYATVYLAQDYTVETAPLCQIERGSTATPYMPYGQIYTDGTVETVASPTLIVESEVTDGTGINSQNGIPVSNPDRCIFTPFFVKAGTKVIWSANASKLGGYLIQYSQPVVSPAYWISSIAASPVEYIEGVYRRSAIATVDCYVVCQATASWSEMKNYNWKVTKPGSTATAEMLLKVGNYQDVQEILSGNITRNVGVKVLDGTEEDLAFNTQYNVAYFYIADKKIGETIYTPLLCSHLRNNSTPYAAMGYGEISSTIRDNGINMKVSSDITSLALFKQWLADQYNAGTPVIVVYPIRTPTTEVVAGQTLQVTQGDNTLEITQASIDGLELEAKYSAAVALTIQEVQDANLDPNVEVTII